MSGHHVVRAPDVPAERIEGGTASRDDRGSSRQFQILRLLRIRHARADVIFLPHGNMTEGDQGNQRAHLVFNLLTAAGASELSALSQGCSVIQAQRKVPRGEHDRLAVEETKPPPRNTLGIRLDPQMLGDVSRR